MNTRMDRYRENSESTSRVARNKELYEKTIETDIDKVNLANNVSVLNSDGDDLDINKLKEMISDRYPKRREIKYDDVDVEDEDIEPTKEYDLKKVIDEVRDKKPNDYESNRFKKIREGEFEILNNLNLQSKEEARAVEILKDDEQTLVDLIKTVNMNAIKRQEEKENSLMSGLMSNDNTEVLKPVTESTLIDNTEPKPTLVEEIEKTKQLSKLNTEEIKEIEKSITTDEKEEPDTESDIPLVNTFYTGNLSIKESDLDDFRDLQKELKSNNVLVKILIILVVIIILGVLVYLLNKYMNLGLF